MEPIKFTEMELVDDEDVETMVALYCYSNQNAPIHLFAELAIVESTEDPTPLGEEDGPQEPCMVVPISYVDDEDVETMVALYCYSNQNAPIHLFAELAIVESTEDPTPLGEEDGPQEPCMVVPISYVGSQSTTHGIDIDLNATPETDVDGDDVYRSSDPSDYEVDIDTDPDVDDVPDDIDDEGVNEDENINASLVGNQIRRIVIHNSLGAHMSRIDPDAVHAAEFPEYP
ncbi:hypothetical protein GOBAR_AA10433 [Gossypium barbadense]|uniref:Uncharacterized protein n=1 Tax=Gossypium barbadense TaxID=3634 RepID=A0A2P5Y3R5_GOSBA|nr:hypothetical protein GOBAR_AA10433 [Gossypium barbadense]